MKLLTKEIVKKLPLLGATEDTPLEDKLVVVKYFTPYSNWTWYAVEGQWEGTEDWRPLTPEEVEAVDEKDFTFFGLVDGFEREWGYWSLSEFESVNGNSNPLLKVERDLYFEPKTIKELKLG